MGPVSLRVDMRYGNESAYAHYANFSVDSVEKHYALTLSGYTGTAGKKKMQILWLLILCGKKYKWIRMGKNK